MTHVPPVEPSAEFIKASPIDLLRGDAIRLATTPDDRDMVTAEDIYPLDNNFTLRVTIRDFDTVFGKDVQELFGPHFEFAVHDASNRPFEGFSTFACSKELTVISKNGKDIDASEFATETIDQLAAIFRARYNISQLG